MVWLCYSSPTETNKQQHSGATVMSMITVDNKAEAFALIDAATDKGYATKLVKLVDCFLIIVYA